MRKRGTSPLAVLLPALSGTRNVQSTGEHPHASAQEGCKRLKHEDFCPMLDAARDAVLRLEERNRSAA
jgi:hypothetical protein